jgi:hypothetical protein
MFIGTFCLYKINLNKKYSGYAGLALELPVG